MIEELKPYESYKRAGLRWAERIPAHWEVDHARSSLQKVNQRSLDGREELLTVSSARGVVPRKTATVTMFKAKSYAGYKLCWPDDLVINSLWAWAGGLGVSRHHGIVSSAYGVYRTRPSSKLLPRYVHELVRSAPFNWELQVRSKGIWISRLQLSDDAFLAAPVLVPPPEEQEAIVRFLDHANRRIDEFIRAKKKLISLLNERKQAIIHRAVTRGLDQSVKLKESGVTWLGQIPAHWEVRPLKAMAAVQSGITLGKDYGARELVEYPYLRVANVQAGRIALDRVTTVRVPPSDAIRSLLRAGDVLMTEGGDADKLGRGCVWQGEITPCLHQNHVFAVRPYQHHLRPLFLQTLLAAPYSREYFTRTAKQTTNLAATNKTTVGNHRVATPPLAEQDAILAAIAEQLSPVETSASAAEGGIALLREYRTRLIADVVTGQLDVRAAAEGLPVVEPEAALTESEGDETDIEDGEAA